jgi:hypothetical protein
VLDYYDNCKQPPIILRIATSTSFWLEYIAVLKKMDDKIGSKSSGAIGHMKAKMLQ